MWEKNISFSGITKEDGGDGKPFSYGLGWMMSDIEGRQVIHHGGSTGKMSSFTMIDVKNEVAVSILTNIDMTFIDKYAYPTVFNIINNILRFATGLPISKYGLPVVKDPTINHYSLNDTLEKHYEGAYQLKSKNVVFLYQGADLKIRRTTNGLECTIYRDKQILNQCTIDFVNEAFAVSRNIASTAQLRFKLNPQGKVLGLLFGDMEFIREDEASAMSTKIIFSPRKKLSFRLPKEWTIVWNKDYFIAQSPGGKVQLMGHVFIGSAPSSRDSTWGMFFNTSSILESGLSHLETFGNYKWEEKTFFCKSDSKTKQIITLHSTINGNELYFAFIAPEGELTTDIHDIMNSLLNSVKTYERN